MHAKGEATRVETWDRCYEFHTRMMKVTKVMDSSLAWLGQAAVLMANELWILSLLGRGPQILVNTKPTMQNACKYFSPSNVCSPFRNF